MTQRWNDYKIMKQTLLQNAQLLFKSQIASPPPPLANKRKEEESIRLLRKAFKVYKKPHSFAKIEGKKNRKVDWREKSKEKDEGNKRQDPSVAERPEKPSVTPGEIVPSTIPPKVTKCHRCGVPDM